MVLYSNKLPVNLYFELSIILTVCLYNFSLISLITQIIKFNILCNIFIPTQMSPTFFIIKLLNFLGSFQKIMYGRRFYLIRQILFRILGM